MLADRRVKIEESREENSSKKGQKEAVFRFRFRIGERK